MAVRRCRLVVASGPDQGKTVELESMRIRIGAQKGNDLALADRLVSGHHCEISLAPDGFLLRDLDSTNGTWLAGHRVREAFINPGSVIYLGESRLRFEPLDEAAEIALSPRDRFGDLVGSSVSMRALYALLERIAPTEASVFIHGETGTGKEVVAEAIHRHSARKDGPLVVVDCGSIAANLIASELFGHEKGAFTGASAAHEGAFERANGGTIFLDEIGELPLELQPNLLGVLERRQVKRVGGSKTIPLDLRVIAATNRDLASEMNRGGFRSDLFYRLAVVRVQLPPLRERMEDLPLLVEHFLSRLPGGERGLAPEIVKHLERHAFPGNVRELRNLVEQAVIFPDGLDAPPPADRTTPALPASGDGARLEYVVDDQVPYRVAKQRLVIELDRLYLKQLLDRHGGNVSAAARAAGLDRMTVHKLIRRAGLDRE
jgi:DNA-binding NtrC family response regulator